MTREEMIRAREAREAADQTMVCFVVDGRGYAAITPIRDSWVKIERAAASKGGKLKARIRLNANDRAALMHRSCIYLGTVEELTAAYHAAYEKARGKKAPKNNGWMFECAVTEQLARQSWEPDNVPFWEAPDVVINGVGYQVKADRAEYFTETSLSRAMAGC